MIDTDRTVLITGATDGLGKAMALLLAGVVITFSPPAAPPKSAPNSTASPTKNVCPSKPLNLT